MSVEILTQKEIDDLLNCIAPTSDEIRIIKKHDEKSKMYDKDNDMLNLLNENLSLKRLNLLYEKDLSEQLIYDMNLKTENKKLVQELKDAKDEIQQLYLLIIELNKMLYV